jgi:hypothetical protein
MHTFDIELASHIQFPKYIPITPCYTYTRSKCIKTKHGVMRKELSRPFDLRIKHIETKELNK